MASLGQEFKKIRNELWEHRVNAVERNQKPFDPNRRGRQNATRFWGYCRANGHFPSYCGKKIRDEERKKLQNEAKAEKQVTFTQNYNKRRGLSLGSGNWTSRNDDDQPRRSIALDKQVSYNRAIMSTPKLTPEKNSERTIRIRTTPVEIDLLSQGTTRIITTTDTRTTEQDHQTS